MASLAWETSLPARQRRLFLDQFEQDLDFFKLFFLLANKSRVTRHMGVLWARDGPAADMGLHNVVGTEQAMQSAFARYVSCDKELDPEFCHLVNGFREHETESCGVSDRAAEKRCRETGLTQIYTCHAGLVDVAVPVIADGQYIATLLCGQVLREPPTPEGFESVRKSVAHLTHIDMDRLRPAYFRVPVSGEEEIRSAAQLMEAFAGHMATAWSRLSRLVRERHRVIREQALLRHEFAWTMLDGPAADRAELRDMLARLELKHPPNRILVLELDPEGHRGQSGRAVFDVTVTGALQAVEEIGDDLEDVVPAYLRKQGICIFIYDPEGSRSRARELAERILRRLEGSRTIRARIGIGGRREDLRNLAESYEEARTALGRNPSAIAMFEPRADSGEDLSAAADGFCELLGTRSLMPARQAAAALPVLALQSLGTHDTDAHRRFFRSTLYSISAAVRRIGMEPEPVRQFLRDTEAALEHAGSVVEIHDVFRSATAGLLDRSRELYSGRANRLVERACRIIEQRIEGGEPVAHIAPLELAGKLGISVSHLSRTFKQVTGVTFERTVMERRVELAKRLLLDPALNVSQVAARCGFTDAAYFARVFRSVAGCTPREYMRDPLRHSGAANGEATAPFPPDSKRSSSPRSQASNESPESHS
ncbi:MAG TPA: PocR ligand-binding domain-containing protein [Bryobacteraceae bacterium]|nr:PocR ligand-binding domain-containing protein [Bryobacteraceae bacterium]